MGTHIEKQEASMQYLCKVKVEEAYAHNEAVLPVAAN
jgi:hypothetical protein